jgi:hypothetical protein
MVAMATMVVAGRWLLLEADVPQVAAGTWMSAGDLGAIPDGTASASLADGRLVIAGGRTSEGTLVAQVGIYDPATQSWEDGGQLAMARAGHTATALRDGRVLFAGGRTENGVTFDVEIYNPTTKQSTHVGDLWAPRVNHAATELKNGLVLVVGGSDGSVVVDYVELFDPESGQTQSLVTRLIESREKATATTLLDGHVLIAGGRNETGTLATAEIFDSGSHSVFPTGAMRAARSGHVAVLLPNNNQVLIAGGTVGGAASATAELYADWRDGFTAVPNAMAQARTGAVGGALPRHDLGFVAGGGSGTGEFFGYATVKTDRDDYWPGETVTITGSGWQPGERVTLKISEDADSHNDFTYYAVADQQGNIVNAEFAPIENDVFHHFGMRFYLTATGGASTALNTFTDGNASVTGTVTSSVTGLPLAGATVRCIAACSGSPTIATNALGVYTLSFAFPGNPPPSTTVTIEALAEGYVNQTTTVTVTVNQQSQTRNFALVPDTTATTTTVSTSGTPSIYGDAVTFTASVNPSTATGSVQFQDNGVNLGAPVAVSGGQAALVAGALVAGAHPITAVFTGTGSFGGSTSAVLTQQVDPKTLTVTASNQSKVYGTAVTPAGTEFTVNGLIGTDSVTSVTLNSTGYAATASVAASPHAITPSAAVGTGLTNYNIVYAPGTMTVTARAVAVSADAKTKVYGADDPELTYQLTSGTLVGSDAFSGALAREAGQNVGSYAIEQGSLTLGTNYNITFTGANLTITPATLAVTAQPKTKEYGSDDPALTYLTSGLQFTDTPGGVLTGALSRVAGETVAGSPYAIGQGSLVANGNYIIVFTPSTLTITPTALTVVAQARTKVYGEADPVLTYSASGFKFSDTAEYVLTGGLTRAEGETVLGGPYAIGQGSLAANTNYTISFTGATLSITPKAASATPDAASKEYGAADPAFTGTLDGFLAADSVTAAYTRTAGETVLGSPYTISATLSPTQVLSNYDITYNTASFTINKATPIITWAAPADITYPTALSVTQLNATANVGGSFVYTPPSGTLLNAGAHTLQADFTPADGDNYNTASKSVPLTVQKGNQTITFGPLGNKTFGDPPVPVSATGGASGNPVTFSTPTPTICSVAPGVPNAATVTLLAVGVCTVRASQAGSSNYNAAPDVDQSFSVAAWTANGFHQPVGIPNSVFAPAGTAMLTSPPAGAWNSARGGSTIPLKFNVFAAGVEQTSTADVAGFFVRMLTSCDAAADEEAIEIFDTAGQTVLRYDGLAGSGGQFIQNWKTPAVRAEQCYRVEVKFRDASSLYTFVKLKK